MQTEPIRNARGLLLDLNGVFFEDDRPLPGAVETIHFLKGKGIPCRYITNTTTHSIRSLHRRLLDMGFPIEPREILSPAAAALLHLRHKGRPSLHLVLNDDIREDFSEFPAASANPDVVVIGDIGDRWNYTIMNHLFEMVMFGAEILALHKGRYWQVEGGLRLDIGAFVAGLEYASGREAIVVGKPSPSFFQMALEDLGLRPDETAMIGDDIFSDVAGAKRYGIPGVLVKTGKFRNSEVQRSGIAPDGVLETIGELMDILK